MRDAMLRVLYVLWMMGFMLLGSTLAFEHDNNWLFVVGTAVAYLPPVFDMLVFDG